MGDYLKAIGAVLKKVDKALPIRAGVANIDIIRGYLGLLVQGKGHFDAIENHRGDKFYSHALGIELLASSPTLRQRMYAQASSLSEQVPAMIEKLLRSHRPDFDVLPCGCLAVDTDIFAMDNGGTANECVERTYYGRASRGDWFLNVRDLEGQDVCRLNRWSLDRTIKGGAAAAIVRGAAANEIAISDNPKSGSYPVAGSDFGSLNRPTVGAILALT